MAIAAARLSEPEDEPDPGDGAPAVSPPGTDDSTPGDLMTDDLMTDDLIQGKNRQ